MKNTETSFDEIIDNLLSAIAPLKCEEPIAKQIAALNHLRQRLFSGEIHIAIIGQFNRGKSSFINRLIKKDVLPTSVLPLTAIPTEIRYGQETRVVIDFEDGTQKEADEASAKEALSTFVTENNNPENKAGVSKAVVYCDSEFLSGSTIIIDTPGFGSTHIHNTKATLNILPSCDAVFFMLSADLPITQMELNFIKQIIPQSSRIFFIYNKIDLLTEADLKTTSEFIIKTIKNKLGTNIANWFLAVSAKNETGMEVISNEVLGFLRKEKFFSLSQAIERKLYLSINAISQYATSIEAVLDGEIDAVTNELKKLKAEFSVNEREIKKFTGLRDKWTSFPFIMTRSEKIRRISEDVDQAEILNMLLNGKNGVFEDKRIEFAQKNSRVKKEITNLTRKLIEIENGQKPARKILQDVQRCMSSYIQ